MTLSLCMIVKNEEEVLSRCLTSFEGVFDEIIIVDTGSCDNTINIAKKFTDKVYNFKWIDDFSAARNFSFSFATCDFIMWLDADDVITPTEKKKLLELKNSLTPSVSVVMLKYAIAFDEQNNATFTYYRERILNRNENFVWLDPVHEAITPRGNITYGEVVVEHRKIKPTLSGRNLKIYENMKKTGMEFKPRQLFYYARELYFNGKYKQAISIFKQFLKTENGYKENYIETCLNLSRCYVATNNIKLAKEILFYSFNYDTPRSEILCELGNMFLLELNYSTAIYYYNLALLNTPNFKHGGFVVLDCYNFIPYVQLCVCHYYLNNLTKAKHYHNLAKEIKPLSPIILKNDEIFK